MHFQKTYYKFLFFILCVFLAPASIAASGDCYGVTPGGNVTCIKPVYSAVGYQVCDNAPPYPGYMSAANACLGGPFASLDAVAVAMNCYERYLAQNGTAGNGTPAWAPDGAPPPYNLCSNAPSHYYDGHWIFRSGLTSGGTPVDGFLISAYETPSCPSGYSNVVKVINGRSELVACKPVAAPPKIADIFNVSKPYPASSCPVRTPKPITPLIGVETHTVNTGFSVGGQSLSLTWDNRKVFAAASAGVTPRTFGNLPALGALWESSFHKNIWFDASGSSAQMLRGNGTVVSFKFNSATSTYTATADVNDKLELISGAYRYTTPSGVVESYNANGQITSMADRMGNISNYVYSEGPSYKTPDAGYLTSVTDNLGHVLSFAYTLPSDGGTVTDGLLTSITNTVGQAITLAYDTNRNLTSIIWPDGKTQAYLYENSSLPWAMTGMVDENSSHYFTVSYDSAGRAVSSFLTGGVEPYSVGYATPPVVQMTQTYDGATGVTTRSHDMVSPSGVVLTLPNGQASNIDSKMVNGMNMATGLSQPAGSGCAESNNVSAFDANGNLISKDDFKGMRSCMAYDAKNQETTRVEGLANTVDCASVFPANATLPAGARKITTTYHPDWRIPATVTAPGTKTTTVYQGQTDPFNANVVANCTSAPALPNGKVLPVVCKQVTQATNDLNGGNPTQYDTYFDSNTLILHGDGANGSRSVLDSGPNARTITVNGGASISTTQSKFGGSSISFDGSTGYLVVPASQDFNFGAGDFTIETWLYKTANNANVSRIWNVNGDVFDGISSWIDPSGNWGVYMSTNGGSWGISNGAVANLANNQWYHLAITRSGNNLYAFVNGVPTLISSGLGTTPLYFNPGAHVIGGQAGTPRMLNGYLDDFRITKGVARYTSAFTPSTTTFGERFTDAALPHITTYTYDTAGRMLSSKDTLNRATTYAYYTDTTFDGTQIDPMDPVVLLLHGDGLNASAAIIDSSRKNIVPSQFGAVSISTTQSMFGGASISFDGSTGYLLVPASQDFNFGAGDFTIETWLYKTANNANYSRIWNVNGDVFDGISSWIDPSGNFVVKASTNGSTWTQSLTVAPLANGQWYHLAIARSGGNLFAYVNGAQYTVTTALGSTPLYFSPSLDHVIGGQAGTPRMLNGYLDDFRITKGVARYTSAFTPLSGADFDLYRPVATSVGHTVGDLQSITDPSGKVTTFDLYDPLGHIRQSTDPKGVVTQMTYSPRDWVTSVSTTAPGQAARTTVYSYDSVGQLTGIASPDGTNITMTYDAAHRLVGASDAKGNSVSYTLDSSGNRIGEQIKDPSGTLQRQIQTSFDALNRVQQVKVGTP